MPKKEAKAEESKESHKHNWLHFLVVLIIAIVILLIFTNGFSLGVGSAVRGGGSKLPDLIGNGAVLQYMDKRLVNNSLLYNLQVGAGVANYGEARAKESVLRVGAMGDTLKDAGVLTTAFYLDATGKPIQSATTRYITKTNYDNTFVDISVDPLMPESGTGKYSEVYAVLFLGVPINMPSTDGTVTETKFTFYSQADVSLVIKESNENNNNKENSYVFRCAYVSDSYNPSNLRVDCCVHRVDPLSVRSGGVNYYCEDYPSYHILYQSA